MFSTHLSLRRPLATHCLWCLLLGAPGLACSSGSSEPPQAVGGGSAVGGATSGGASGVGGSTSGGSSPALGGTASVGGAVSSGGASSAGGALPNVGGTPSAGGAAGGSGSGGIEGSGGASLSMVAEELDGLIVDSRCDAATQPPLANGATCQHLAGMQHVETAVQLGGDAGTVYQVKLRVRGIWEPTNITGGTKGPESFTVGGMVTPGSGSDSDAVNYQQFFLEVAEPKQTYWLNNYPMLGHVIHKEDYEVTIPMAGETEVKVIKNDGNGRQIANFPGEKFDDLPPYDQTATLGQLLHLDVLEVTVEP